MIDRTRQEWLRGAYQDRIIEVARWLAEKRSTFDKVEVAQALNDEYNYLHELTADDHAYLREETIHEIERIIRERREAELRSWYRLLIAQTVALFKMDSASRAYDFDHLEFDAAVGKALNNTDVPVEDWDLFRDIVLTDLWPKLKMAHAELRASAFSHLRSLTPSTIAEDAVFSMDVGWAKLVQQAATRIESYPTAWKARIISGKEKLGCLVLSVDCDYSGRGCRAEVERLREEIRLVSLATCEICGSPGRLRLAGFAKTVCDTHVGVLGELREDDGAQADPYNWNDDDYPAATAEFLKDMDPVRLRPTVHVLDEDAFGGWIARQIEADLRTKSGREHEVLFEFCGALENSATRAVAKSEDIDRYVTEEVGSWASVQPLSDADKEFLRGYLRGLIEAENERSRFFDDFGSGLEMMQEAQADGVFDDLDSGDEDDGADKKTRH
ncbi:MULTISPECIES: hypothetical protein [Rhizobium]|uniref:hypothetical protein n=1 Tax=Rhizobium TaxID=379 RepID=UPI000412AD71|nr:MULTISPECIES: hypothetical protein [Rhizobium]UFS81517.1 hypothetical protein LPB79_24920 [Rhizobium sp. T136]